MCRVWRHCFSGPSGIALVAVAPSGRIDRPGCDHQQRKTCVNRRKNPTRGLVKDELLDPVLNKTLLLVAGCARLDPEPRFKSGERALLPQPGLQDDPTNRRQMRQAITQRIDPGPDSAEIADKNACQPTHHENHNAQMGDKHEIGKNAVGHLGEGCYANALNSADGVAGRLR